MEIKRQINRKATQMQRTAKFMFMLYSMFSSNSFVVATVLDLILIYIFFVF